MKPVSKKIILLASVALTLAACGNKENKSEAPAPEDSASAVEIPDTTIYGTALECGMSTMTLVSTKGDTIYMEKDDDKGYGDIYGYFQDEDSFAVTLRDGKDAKVIVKAYNLSLLKRFNVDFGISNGLFVVNGKDTVDIDYVDDDSLVVVNPKNKEKKVYYPKRR